MNELYSKLAFVELRYLKPKVLGYIMEDQFTHANICVISHSYPVVSLADEEDPGDVEGLNNYKY
ncbi:hypothetical protein KFK09_028643 [Dendrobium nobile]|uniref:Uncharacterized protein n=1 Tax=Dendrobium nobile TaxID=94219 RepID=A0A8T3A2H2_DENNO|nr:hypothetical protein KFK09_028643 [Dendrobium nobile]